uniref:Uncharacterized protein n=1 Tax=Cacopsylla melanoneura TaxID=428564 RepID=A0A8D9EE18_9HEMI
MVRVAARREKPGVELAPKQVCVIMGLKQGFGRERVRISLHYTGGSGRRGHYWRRNTTTHTGGWSRTVGWCRLDLLLLLLYRWMRFRRSQGCEIGLLGGSAS